MRAKINSRSVEALTLPKGKTREVIRHETFARRIAEGHSATGAYASSFGRKRDSTASVGGHYLIRNPKIRERAMVIEAENALRTLPTFALILKGLERRTLRQIENAQMTGVFGAADRFAAFVEKMNKAIEPPPGLKCYVRGERESL